MPTTALAPTRAGLGRDAGQRQVARSVEDIAELLDLAAGKALQAAQQPAADARGIGHVAEDELAGRIAGVQQAIKFLPVAAGGEEEFFRLLVGGMDAGGHRKELDVAVEGAEFAGHAGDTRTAALLGLFHHAGVRLLAAFVDDLGNLRDFAAEGAFQSGADAADKTQRINAIADDKFPRAEPFQVEAIHFVTRQSGHDGHDLILDGG